MGDADAEQRGENFGRHAWVEHLGAADGWAACSACHSVRWRRPGAWEYLYPVGFRVPQSAFLAAHTLDRPLDTARLHPCPGAALVSAEPGRTLTPAEWRMTQWVIVSAQILADASPDQGEGAARWPLESLRLALAGLAASVESGPAEVLPISTPKPEGPKPVVEDADRGHTWGPSSLGLHNVRTCQRCWLMEIRGTATSSYWLPLDWPDRTRPFTKGEDREVLVLPSCPGVRSEKVPLGDGWAAEFHKSEKAEPKVKPVRSHRWHIWLYAPDLRGDSSKCRRCGLICSAKEDKKRRYRMPGHDWSQPLAKPPPCPGRKP